MSIGVAGWLPVNNFLSLFVRDELGGDLLGAALLLIAIQGGTATLGLAGGLWIHRVGSRWTYALGLAGMTAFVLVMTVAAGAAVVLVAAPFLGVALALHWAGSQTYVLEVSPAARRGLATGIMSFAIIAAPGIAGIAFGQI
ncbi:MAG: MFS transporter, partial [Chloroflexi bacterium]|nr:MFS transporter [Chloroflexota bacterium]